jgi:hypothetical protein
MITSWLGLLVFGMIEAPALAGETPSLGDHGPGALTIALFSGGSADRRSLSPSGALSFY